MPAIAMTSSSLRNQPSVGGHQRYFTGHLYSLTKDAKSVRDDFIQQLVSAQFLAHRLSHPTQDVLTGQVLAPAAWMTAQYLAVPDAVSAPPEEAISSSNA
jgi:hypothetical protein